jgi:hypothetical protein
MPPAHGLVIGVNTRGPFVKSGSLALGSRLLTVTMTPMMRLIDAERHRK